MDADEAIKNVREACLYLADEIGKGCIYFAADDAPPGTEVTYDDLLSNTASYFFENEPEISKSFEHVIHWILFGAGAEISMEKIQPSDDKSYAVLRVNDLGMDAIETGIEKYKEHIGKLAGMIKSG